MITTANGLKKLQGTDYPPAAFYDTDSAFNGLVDAVETAQGEIDTLQTGKAAATHTHAASGVTAGALGGKVTANATAAADLTAAQVRDIYAGTAELTSGTSALPTGAVYLMYE